MLKLYAYVDKKNVLIPIFVLQQCNCVYISPGKLNVPLCNGKQNSANI
jgi:hypothetical protein